ncbi:hypothetical protein ACSBR1_023817 [Camellia fascicularis]
MDAKALFKLFTKFGIVKDAYIPFKRRKVTNSRFGFVCYNCCIAASVAIQKENGLLVDDSVLEVKMAAYDRNSRSEQSKRKLQPPRRFLDTSNFRGKAAYVEHRFFAEVLKGDTSVVEGDTNIIIKAKEEGNGWLYESAIIRFNTEYSTHNILKVLKEKGLEQIEVKKGGGRDIIISFKSTNELQSNIGKIKEWFKDWSQFVMECKPDLHLQQERCVWLRCYGGSSKEKEACVEGSLMDGSEQNSKNNDGKFRCAQQASSFGYISRFNDFSNGIGPSINLEVNLANEPAASLGPGINLEVILAHSPSKFLASGPEPLSKPIESGNLNSINNGILAHAQSAGPLSKSGPTGKRTLNLIHSAQAKPTILNTKSLHSEKKKRKKKTHLEGFTSFARFHGYRTVAAHKHSSKPVIFRPATSAFAQSDLYDGGSSSNNYLLDEAKATIHLGKSLGINYNGEEDIVLSKIIDLELKNKDKIFNEGKNQQ